MSAYENSLDISYLFSSNLDEFLRAVFLHLDPASLKNSRCVSRQWNCFIKERVWDSTIGMEALNKKLKLLWQEGTPIRIKKISSQRRINGVKCDMKFVYCCTWEGFIDVYEIVSGKMKYELDCFPDKRSEDPDVDYHLDKYFGLGIILEIGDDIIVASQGREGSAQLFVWEKETGELCYQAKNHENGYILAIKVFNNYIVSGADDGSIVLLEESKRREWKLKIKMNDIEYYDGYWLDHIDVEGDWLVTGNGRCIKIWSLEDLEKSTVGAIPLMVMDIADFDGCDFRRPKLNFVVQFPFIIVIGCESWEGVQVWNGETGSKIREIQIEGDAANESNDFGEFDGLDEVSINKSFFHIHSSGDIVILTSESRGNDAIHLYDAKELCNDAIPDEKLWSRVLDVDGADVCGAGNKTSLIISDMAGVKIQHFWDIGHTERTKQSSIKNYFHPI